MREDVEIGAHPSLYEYCEKMIYSPTPAKASRKRYGLNDDKTVH